MLLVGEVFLFVHEPTTAALVPVLFLPVLALGIYWHKHGSDHIDLDMLVRTFAAAFFGSVFVLVGELLLTVRFPQPLRLRCWK